MKRRVYRFYVAHLGEMIGYIEELGRAQDKYGFNRVKVLDSWLQ